MTAIAGGQARAKWVKRSIKDQRRFFQRVKLPPAKPGAYWVSTSKAPIKP